MKRPNTVHICQHSVTMDERLVIKFRAYCAKYRLTQREVTEGMISDLLNRRPHESQRLINKLKGESYE